MLDKLSSVENRYEEIHHKLMMPDIMDDTKKYTDMMKEYKNLTPIVEKYREYTAAKKSLQDAKDMMDEAAGDKELREMLEDEIMQSKKFIDMYSEELKVLMLPKDKDDDKNVIMEIRGGAGGDEAALFANSLYRMYSMYAESKGWKVELLNINETELGGIKEVSFSINGEGAYSKLKFESGVHRVQRVPETESAGRIHTSTVTVAVLAEVDEVELELNPIDLQIDTFRASGAGGQHVNKTESAIRITHKPTGTVVECQDERSQHKNKDRALKILRSRIYEEMQREQDAQIASERKLQVGGGSRSERIRTYNYPQGRMTDHRIGLTLYKLEAIMNGDLDELVGALITFDQAEKLQASQGQ
ncbi:MAG: peptide chain release factor 1 [Oscillospiraceae bacterium]